MLKFITSLQRLSHVRGLRRTATLLLVAAVILFCFSRLGTWLTVSDQLPPSIDCICTFAGDAKRVDYSKALVLRYRSALWFLSDYKNGHSRLLQKSNFDMSRVTVIDTCKNTLSEVSAMGQWIDSVIRRQNAGDPTHKPHLVYIGLVSSPYHMRRIKLMAWRHLKRKNIQIYLLPVPCSKYNWDEKTFRFWWRSDKTIAITLTELFKTAYFILTGFL